MAVIANLDVVLAARTEKLDRGFAKGQRSAKNFGKSLNSAGSSLSGMTPSLPIIGRLSPMLGKLGPAGLAAGAGIGVMTVGLTAAAGAAAFLATKVKAQLPILDKLGKSSTSIGIAVGDLQAIRLAAGESSGMDEAATDKALQKMVVRIGEAREGLGDASKAFETLGLDAQEVANMDTGEAFRAVAEAAGDIENVSQRNLTLTRLFGKEGAKLAATFADGAEKLDETNAFLDEYGLKLANIDVKGVENANDAMARVATLAEGIFNRITVEFAPVIETIAEDILKGGKEFQGWSASLDEIGMKAAGIYGGMKDIAKLAYGTAQIYAGDMLAGINAISEASKMKGPMEAQLAFAQNRIDAINQAKKDLEENENASNAAARAEAAEKLMQEFAAPTAALEQRIAEIRGLANSGSIGERVANQATRKAIEDFGDAIGKMPALDADFAVSEIRQAFDQGLINQQTFDTLQQKIDEIKNASLIGPDDVAAAEEIAEIADTSNKTASRNSPGFAAVQAGSVAGYQAALRNQRSSENAQLAEMKKLNAMFGEAGPLLGQIAAGIEKLPPQRVVG